MKNVKYLLHDLKRQIPFLILSLLFALCIVGASLSVPILIGKAIDCIVTAGHVDFTAVREYLFQILILVLVAAFFQWCMNFINNRVTYHVVRDIRNRAFDKLQKLPLGYLDTHPTGDIVSKMIVDVDTFADGLLMGFSQMFIGFMTIIGTLGFMLLIQPKIAILVVCVTPLSLVVANFIAKHTFSMFVKQSETRGKQTALIDEMLSQLKVVKAYGYEEEAEERFNRINEELYGCSKNAVFYSSLTNPCTRFVNAVVYALVALTGGIFCIGGALTVGALTTFLSYANQYTKPFNEISAVVTELQNALVCVGRVYQFLDEKEEAESTETVKMEEASGAVDCRQVAFSYTPDRKLIENFSLQVKKGQRVAIVGPTGCGKTTFINLLMRFYDVQEGSISVDGKDIRSLKRHDLRKNYGMVLQETWLKNGTIRENICMGKEDATMEEVVAAAKASHAHSFIKRLPEGYDTVIGETEGLLSEGQKQLLCISRIMLSIPPMLILDEATSSIDTRTEQKIQNAFAKLMKGRTSFIVAHRLQTIQNADVILVMKDGKVIEQGNHETLLKKNGFYAKMFYNQFAENASELERAGGNTVQNMN